MPFKDIAGHQHLLDLIAGAAVRGSLPPSVIFAGPEGVGKRTAALALAQLLNCLAPVGNDACGECAACRRIARGVHADVLLIEPEDGGSIKVDAIRDAIDRAAYRPFEGRRRVVIIDQADEVLEAAQNALLKTLEEPPPASMFVLVTSRPDLLLPTVRSRCQRLRFGRLSPADVAAVLIRSHEYTDSDAHAAAALSDGSVGRALEGGTESFTDARDAAAQLLEGATASEDPRRRLESAKALIGTGRAGADRDEVARRLRAVSSLLRDVGLLLERLQRSFDSDRALAAFAAVDRALNALDRNASPKIVADWVAFQI